MRNRQTDTYTPNNSFTVHSTAENIPSSISRLTPNTEVKRMLPPLSSLMNTYTLTPAQLSERQRASFQEPSSSQQRSVQNFSHQPQQIQLMQTSNNGGMNSTDNRLPTATSLNVPPAPMLVSMMVPLIFQSDTLSSAYHPSNSKRVFVPVGAVPNSFNANNLRGQLANTTPQSSKSNSAMDFRQPPGSSLVNNSFITLIERRTGIMPSTNPPNFVSNGQITNPSTSSYITSDYQQVQTGIGTYIGLPMTSVIPSNNLTEYMNTSSQFDSTSSASHNEQRPAHNNIFQLEFENVALNSHWNHEMSGNASHDELPLYGKHKTSRLKSPISELDLEQDELISNQCQRQKITNDKEHANDDLEEDYRPSSLSGKKSTRMRSIRRRTCPICQKVCSRPSTLKTHLLIHSGALPFACSFPNCYRKFNVKSNLTRHIRSRHKDHEKTP